jgi:hypothetical protein
MNHTDDNHRVRKLRDEEMQLVIDLTSGKPNSESIQKDLDKLLVTDLSDGGMGSVRTAEESGESARKTSTIANGLYSDSDGTIISVEVSVDANGKLFEIDIWKTDFSVTMVYPNKENKIG